MKIVIATHNPGKLARYRGLLDSLPEVALLSLDDIGITTKVPEPFETAEENAIYKVTEYVKLTNLPTLAVDEAVTTNFLPEGEQPGVYVRRYADKQTEMTDEETLHFWKEIFSKNDQADKQFIWDFNIAFLREPGMEIKKIQVTMRSAIADTFSETIVQGYPMSSFLIMEGTSKPAADLSIEERHKAEKDIFASFIEAFPSWIVE